MAEVVAEDTVSTSLPIIRAVHSMDRREAVGERHCSPCRGASMETIGRRPKTSWIELRREQTGREPNRQPGAFCKGRRLH